MKIYLKPTIIAVVGFLFLTAVAGWGITAYLKYMESMKEPVFVEQQVDFQDIYEEADADHIASLYNGRLIENHNPVRFIGGDLYLPVDIVIDYVNDQFFYDDIEGTLTYTTQEDIIRIKSDELTYTVNDEPLMLDIGMTRFEDIAYLPISLVQKFAHHDFIFSETYHVLQIVDWYAEITTGEVYYEEEAAEDVYIRIEPQDQSRYIHKAYIGMSVQIVGEDKDYYQVVTKEGFIGYIGKDFVRSVTTLHSRMEPVQSYDTFVANKFEGKVTIVWNAVYNSNANLKIEEYMENATGIDVISPTWFALADAKGNVRSLADLNYVRWAHENGYQVWALLHNLGYGYTGSMTHEVLSSTEKRAEVIRQMLSYAEIYELDGINIDLEAIRQEDGEYYVQFCKEMAVYAKQQGLVVSADVPVVKSWTTHYGRDQLAAYLDYVIVMGYDEHWGTSPVAGSVASRTWTEEGITDTLREVPKEKLIIGIPFYTRLWMEEAVEGETNVSSAAYGMDSGKALMDEKEVQWEWLDDIGQYYAEYEEDDVRYRMWLEDVASVEERMKLAAGYDVGGMAAWRVGFENDEVWEVIEEYMKPD